LKAPCIDTYTEYFKYEKFKRRQADFDFQLFSTKSLLAVVILLVYLGHIRWPSSSITVSYYKKSWWSRFQPTTPPIGAAVNPLVMQQFLQRLILKY